MVPPEIVRKSLRQPVTRDLCVTDIGAFVGAKSHYVERRSGAQQSILIGCVAGKGACILKGAEWSLEAGSMLFLPPGCEHVYYADAEEPWTIYWVHFRGLRVDDYLAALGVSTAAPVLRVNAPTVLTEAFEDTFRHTLHGFGEAAMTGLSTAFARLLGLAKVHKQTSTSQHRSTEERMARVLVQMRENLTQPWTIADLAKIAGLSTSHFAALCRKQTGMPPLSWLIQLRMQTAMGLLQQNTHNVAEAALAVGYSDPFYFSRLFRKHMGLAPSTCRSGP